MGCGSSTPVKHELGSTTSAKKHYEMRTKDSSQHGPVLDVGPNYVQVKHLGESACSWVCCQYRQDVVIPADISLPVVICFCICYMQGREVQEIPGHLRIRELESWLPSNLSRDLFPKCLWRISRESFQCVEL